MEHSSSVAEPLLAEEGQRREGRATGRPVSPPFQCNPSGCVLTSNDDETADSKERDEARRKLTAAICLSFVFMAVEIAGGVLANSLAIMTDAAHLLSDIAGFAISLFAIWMAGWEATPRHTFGYHRMEILGALLSVQLIWMITGIIVYEAIVRLLYTEKSVDGRTMFITASFGVGVNILMMLLFSHHHHHGVGGHSHDHAHGQSHDHNHNHSHNENKSNSRPQPKKRWWNLRVKEEDSRHGCATLSPSTSHRDLEHGSSNPPKAGRGGHGHARHEDGNHHDGGCGHSSHDDHDHHGHEHGGHDHHGHGGIVKVCVCTPEECSCSNRGRPALRRRLSSQVEQASKVEENINLRGAYLHVLGDLVQSIGVMIAGAVIWWRPEWKVVDLFCTLLFSLLVLITTIKIVRDILEVLMESTPRAINAAELEMRLLRLEDVIDVHDLHIWAITMGKTMLACHVRINPDADTDDVLRQVTELCEKKYKIEHVTIQVEKWAGADG